MYRSPAVPDEKAEARSPGAEKEERARSFAAYRESAEATIRTQAKWRIEIERRIEVLAAAAERVSKRLDDSAESARMLDCALQIRGLLDPVDAASPSPAPPDEAHQERS